jgi:S-(hydroxymethyl)glutathione dehydrogenase/alcohol dehydrogenase
MKAAVLEALNSPLTVSVNVEPGALAFGQVLVKVLVAGICGAQLQEIAGHKGNGKFLPHLMGHEGCGIVDEIGPGVSKVVKGDKVVMHWRKGDGIEADFPTYLFNDKEIKSGKVTTFSEYSIVSENRITKVPKNTPNDLCALLGCSLSTGLGVVFEEAKIKPGESLLVAGVGGLGANVLRAASLAHAYPIIAVDIHDDKKEVALSLGAHGYINAAKENIGESLAAAFGLRGVDVVIETSGSKASIENTLPILGDSGRFILIGQPKPNESIEIKDANHLFKGEGKTIKATQGGQFSPSSQIPRYVALYEAGILSIDKLVTDRISLDEINQGIERMRQGKANRIMIDISV